MKLAFGFDREIAGWVTERLPHVNDFGDCRAIGVISGGQLIAGVVYNEYQEQYGTIAVSVAADTPRWAAKGIIRAMLHYPFQQLNVNKVWSAMMHTNERAIRFNKGLGFTQEAVLKDHFGIGQHAVITRMLKSDFTRRYGKEKTDGQKLAFSASSA